MLFTTRLAKNISQPIAALNTRMEKLSHRDLTSPIEAFHRKDELGLLSETAVVTIERLKSYIIELQRVLDSISRGNLDVETNVSFEGDFIDIKKSLDQIIYSLSDTFGEIKQAVHQVSIGADQVSSGAQNLSQGSTEQASSIQELSATINEIGNKIVTNAEDAQRANQLSFETTKDTDKGNSHTKEMMSTMEEISASSSEIGEIIKTIDDIAFQTNILALNATVEAARAAASEELSGQANMLMELLGKFTTRENASYTINNPSNGYAASPMRNSMNKPTFTTTSEDKY